MNYKLLSYAMDFASYLLEKTADAEKIKQIILFGSVARGEETKESDIDLFIETDEKLTKQLNETRDEFYESAKTKKYWKLLGINNQINIAAGNIKTWGDLQRSIIADGIVLYGRYCGKPETEQQYLLIIKPGKDRNKNISVWREIYGYTQTVGKKKYEKKGLIKEYEGKKLAKGVFTIPARHAQKMIHYLRKNHFVVQIQPIWKETEKTGAIEFN